MEFQAVTESQREIASQIIAAKDEIDLSVSGILKQFGSCIHGNGTIKAHFLLRVKLIHHLEERGNFLFRQELEEHVH
jgi:hypothetical protein